MNAKKLSTFFQANGFSVSLSMQDKKQCAEIEDWTDGGVDMVIWLNPFTVEEFKRYVSDFDVDEEIEAHRQDSLYKQAFTIAESLEDFTNFHNRLKEIASSL